MFCIDWLWCCCGRCISVVVNFFVVWLFRFGVCVVCVVCGLFLYCFDYEGGVYVLC